MAVSWVFLAVLILAGSVVSSPIPKAVEDGTLREGRFYGAGMSSSFASANAGASGFGYGFPYGGGGFGGSSASAMASSQSIGFPYGK